MAATSKMCQSLLQRHVTFESTITLKLREIEDEMHTLQERSTLAELQVPVFPTSTPTKSVTPDTGQWQEQPSRLTVTCSTPSLPHVADEVVPEANKALLSPSHVSSMRANSVSRENFSTRLVKELFSSEERVSSNVRGIGKPKLDEKKIALVRKLTFANFPCASTEEKASWSRCIKAIDSASRALSRKEKENRNWDKLFEAETGQKLSLSTSLCCYLFHTVLVKKTRIHVHSFKVLSGCLMICAVCMLPTIFTEHSFRGNWQSA